MLISIIICTHRTDRLGDVNEAIDSVLHQTYSPIEVVVVVDGNRELFKMLSKNRSDKVLEQCFDEDASAYLEENPDKALAIKLVLNEKNLGLSTSRNIGARESRGDVVVFADDDIVADTNWVGELAKMYDNHGAISAGGRIAPMWLGKNTGFLPDEYLWLVGATHKGFPDNIVEVRNAFGSNLSFRRDIFLALGGYRSGFGFNEGSKSIIQGEEAEFCTRMRARFGKGVMYNPQALIYHKVYSSRLRMISLLKRAFWQGYSKRLLKEQSAASLDEESSFLRYLLFDRVPRRLKNVLFNPSVRCCKQLVFLLLCTGIIGAGYFFRFINR